MSTDDTPYQKQINPETKNHESDQEHQNTPPVPRAEPQILPPTINGCNSDQDKRYRLDRRRFYVEIFTLIAIALYTIIAYRQWDAMYKATEATKKSADAAERAVTTAEKTFNQNKDFARDTLK